MKSMKTITGVVVIVIVLLIVFGVLKNFSSRENPSSAAFYNQENNLNNEKSGEKRIIQNPLQWLENNQEESSPLAGQSLQKENGDSALQKILEELRFLRGGDFNLLSINEPEMVGSSEGSEEYWSDILNAWDNGFTEGELELIRKDDEGRVLSLEELIQEAEQGGISEELKKSFLAWHELDERTLEDLQDISVTSGLSSAHRAMLSWFRYHSEVAVKFGQGNLSQEEMETLSGQYLQKAKTEPTKFQQAFSLSEKSLTTLFIRKARAQAENYFYHFGGLITSYGDFCTNGFAVVVSAPKGGLLWIYYPAYIANPYLYKILAPSYYVLGRALWGPGVCNKGYLNYAIGAAQILFFGSSASPL